MMVFLGYMFDEKVLKEVLRDEWLKIYDKAVSKRAVQADCIRSCVWKPLLCLAAASGSKCSLKLV